MQCMFLDCDGPPKLLLDAVSVIEYRVTNYEGRVPQTVWAFQRIFLTETISYYAFKLSLSLSNAYTHSF
jgi:hypothetical protein